MRQRLMRQLYPVASSKTLRTFINSPRSTLRPSVAALLGGQPQKLGIDSFFVKVIMYFRYWNGLWGLMKCVWRRPVFKKRWRRRNWLCIFLERTKLAIVVSSSPTSKGNTMANQNQPGRQRPGGHGCKLGRTFVCPNVGSMEG
jgi:hypothetical protein